MENKFKSGFVTVIGRPNVGKSTLMNHLIGQKIAITSNKPQTTRNRIQTVYTDEERGQIIFLDTPGIHKAKNKLGEYMVQVAERTLKEVDAIMWLVEPSTFVGAGERHIAEQLQKVGVPVILIINKIDTVKKEKACVVGMPVKDTIKIATEDTYASVTPDRRLVWMIQTPQAFSYPEILQAYEKIIADGDDSVTDDAMVLEHAAHMPVKLIEGSYHNIKITTPEDMKIAVMFLKEYF